MQKRWTRVVAATVLLTVASCTSSPESPTTTRGSADVSSTTRAPGTTVDPSSTTTQAPSTTTTTVAPLAGIETVESGLFCRDLFALGYGFRDAVGYWMSEKRTPRMDADRNGVPCETVYPAGAIDALFGSADARSMYLVTTVDYVETPRFVITGSAVRDGVICPAGTAEAIEWPSGQWFWVDEYICDDGSGSFVAGAEIRIGTDRMYEVWEILEGSGAYADLTGGGGGDTGPAGEGLWQDHLYGRVETPNMPMHIPFTFDDPAIWPPVAIEGSRGAAGSGCAPGGLVLPDGLWFGDVSEPRADSVVFDLGCMYTGDAAWAEAERRGHTPYADWYTTNDSDRLRTLTVQRDATVHVLTQYDEPDGDSYMILVPVSFDGWPVPDGYICRSVMGMCPVWVAINDGVVTEIQEQYFP